MQGLITKARRGAKPARGAKTAKREAGTRREDREARSRHNVGRIVYLEHRCIPQLEINGLTAVSVSRREARQALCGWTAMLHELEDQVEAFFEFDVRIGACAADALCMAW